MTLSIVPAEPPATTVTPDQLELVRKTIAKDASPEELQLFLYDCARQGVHPLDHLLHFTKRGGRYTPVTSIDLMRMRAAETGEYAGNDEYEFMGTPARPGFKAAARVWRLVQGQRVPFMRSARWEEYCPPPGQDHMWRRMPHVMLGKCAEAQALRTGFPRQLHGLYAAEELEVGEGSAAPAEEPPPLDEPPMDSYDTVQALPPDAETPAPVPGTVRVTRIDSAPTKNPQVTRYRITLSDGDVVVTIKQALAAQAKQLCEQQTPVLVKVKQTQFGKDLVAFRDPTVDQSIPF